MFSYLRFKLVWTDKVFLVIHIVIRPLQTKISGIWMVQWGEFGAGQFFGNLFFVFIYLAWYGRVLLMSILGYFLISSAS